MNRFSSTRDLTDRQHYGGSGMPLTFKFQKCGHSASSGSKRGFGGMKPMPWLCQACIDAKKATP